MFKENPDGQTHSWNDGCGEIEEILERNIMGVGINKIKKFDKELDSAFNNYGESYDGFHTPKFGERIKSLIESAFEEHAQAERKKIYKDLQSIADKEENEELRRALENYFKN